jgi:rare lipoprotein A
MPRPLAIAGGLPPGLQGLPGSRLLRPFRWVAGGSMLAAALVAALVWLPLGEGQAEAIATAPVRANVLASLGTVDSGLPLDDAAAGATTAAAAAVRPVTLEPAVPEPQPALAPARSVTLRLRGDASYYAAKFEGRRTASGERYRGSALTAAHRTLPFGTKVRVSNPRNGRSVVVRINDRGPFHPRRVIDVSHTAAAELGILRRGLDRVELEVLGPR